VGGFDYLEPQSLAEVTSLLAAYGDSARVFAGGTDLLVQMRRGSQRPRYLLDIKKVPGLDRIQLGEDGIEIGAAVTLYEAERYLARFCEYGCLGQAIHSVASVQIRHRATLAGNVCNASPAADTVPALIVLGAKVKIHGTHGDRTVPVERFSTGPGRTVLLGGEVVSAILLPRLPQQFQGVFLKKSRRPAVDLATVNVAAGDDGKTVKIALGAVAPTVVRARESEQLLNSRGLTPGSIAEAARLSCLAAKPLTDVRAASEYRLQLVAALTGRALGELAAKGGMRR
jgi:carbon-monoxide dehydrogenase medium subunit